MVMSICVQMTRNGADPVHAGYARLISNMPLRRMQECAQWEGVMHERWHGAQAVMR